MSGHEGDHHGGGAEGQGKMIPLVPENEAFAKMTETAEDIGRALDGETVLDAITAPLFGPRQRGGHGGGGGH